jgi:ferredoxin
MRPSRRRFLIGGIGAVCLLLAPTVRALSALAHEQEHEHVHGQGKLRAVVNLEKCNGCETCVDVCPEVFGIEEGGEKAFVKEDPLPPELEGCAIEAAEECMAGAIKIV